jgi:hypothetical protein
MPPFLVRNLKKTAVIKGNKDQNEVGASIKWKNGMKEGWEGGREDEEKKKEMKQEEEERRWMSGRHGMKRRGKLFTLLSVVLAVR